MSNFGLSEWYKSFWFCILLFCTNILYVPLTNNIADIFNIPLQQTKLSFEINLLAT